MYAIIFSCWCTSLEDDQPIHMYNIMATVIDNLVHIYNTDTQQTTPVIRSRMDGKATLTILLITMTYAAGHGMKTQCPSGAQFIATANIV